NRFLNRVKVLEIDYDEEPRSPLSSTFFLRAPEWKLRRIKAEVTQETNDIDELTALNVDFVASVQNSDVRRFDEILAPEFLCSDPDKSLVDRAAFLEQTAKPVAIKNLQAHDVKVRIMGDFAIIHAATSYTTPDGQQAHGRYTDCWAKQNGKWLAVSAHVTR